MKSYFLNIILLSIALFGAVTEAKKYLYHPEGPNQQCRDDAGSPWLDDAEKSRAYFEGFKGKPILKDGKCAKPLEQACADKGALTAYHDGPINCGGKGWFCIIEEQADHMAPGAKRGKFPDANFAFCDQRDFNHDRDGHCHGSDDSRTFGWWIRDHWNRNYAGKLRCCCGWGDKSRGGQMEGYVNRCDYRKYVSAQVQKKCRDANEEHKVDWAGGMGCGEEDNRKALTKPDPETCWEMEYFGPAKLDRKPVGETTKPPTLPPTIVDKLTSSPTKKTTLRPTTKKLTSSPTKKKTASPTKKKTAPPTKEEENDDEEDYDHEDHDDEDHYDEHDDEDHYDENKSVNKTATVKQGGSAGTRLGLSLELVFAAFLMNMYFS